MFIESKWSLQNLDFDPKNQVNWLVTFVTSCPDKLRDQEKYDLCNPLMFYIVYLTHWGLVMLCYIKEVGQNLFRLWLVAWRCKAITWTLNIGSGYGFLPDGTMP